MTELTPPKWWDHQFPSLVAQKQAMEGLFSQTFGITSAHLSDRDGNTGVHYIVPRSYCLMQDNRFLQQKVHVFLSTYLEFSRNCVRDGA